MLNVLGHLAMLVGMWVSMVLRRDEYSIDHSHHMHMRREQNA